MLEARWCRYRLRFRFLAKTSREEMWEKDTYFVKIYDPAAPEIYGIGECGLFKGLSADDIPEYEAILSRICADPLQPVPELSSIRMGFETAFADFNNGGKRTVFNSAWQSGGNGITINGLIWMGDKSTMLTRVEEKLKRGFKILKLKIGGIDFDEEISILKLIRESYSERDLEIRLDVNGSFTPSDALQRLDRLSRFNIHSIEQPIAARQFEAMSRICRESPIPIALDEELIGYHTDSEMENMLESLHPHYIILKPTLCGGFERSDKWIEMAENKGIGWWATSALESNIGLNAIAQWISSKNNPMAQGLGTGELYLNNIQSPLYMSADKLEYDINACWQIPQLSWHQ